MSKPVKNVLEVCYDSCFEAFDFLITIHEVTSSELKVDIRTSVLLQQFTLQMISF